MLNCYTPFTFTYFAMGTLNRYEVIKVWRLSSCKNFVGKREELVFDAFIDSEPVERA